MEQVELGLLLEGIHSYYGFDYRNYSEAPLRRGVAAAMSEEGVATVSALQDRVLHDRRALDRFIAAVGVDATEFFREPEMFTALQADAFPLLRTYPSLRIWVAGCATGEEVYSLAVLLEEAGLLRKSRVFATDINSGALEHGAAGRYPRVALEAAEADYLASGGLGDLAQYVSFSRREVTFGEGLRSRLTWAEHNLLTDASFNEFHLVLCANVMIYFDRERQARVHRLLDQSLIRGGFLAVSSRETLVASPYRQKYRRVRAGAPLYQKAV